MTQRHREFGAPPNQETEPVSFLLQGEEFVCLPVAPSGTLNDFIAGIRTDDRGQRIYSAPNLISFVIGVLREEKPLAADEAEALGYVGEGYEPLTASEARARGHLVEDDDAKVVLVAADDVSRFYELVHDKHRVVPIEQLGDVVLWLSEVLMGRPTRPPGPSRRGRR